jgi:tRNA (guanine37-N1)-methyltransferase
MADYDIIGNIAIIKGDKKTKIEKLKQAKKLLQISGIKTVLEKVSNVKGRLRTIKTKYLAGDKNLIAVYKENACIFKLNVETCYFSPRLANDRKEVAHKIKQKDRVLVMFAGVGPYPIVIYKYSKPKEIVSVELGKEPCKYFKENLKLNKINPEKIKIIQGDVKKKITKELGIFNVIMMARPNLKESFLKYALIVSKKNTKIFYHLFCHERDLNSEVEKLRKEASKLKRQIKVEKITPIGNLAPYKYRYRVEMKVV